VHFVDYTIDGTGFTAARLHASQRQLRGQDPFNRTLDFTSRRLQAATDHGFGRANR
jgi:hypothetical protein